MKRLPSIFRKETGVAVVCFGFCVLVGVGMGNKVGECVVAVIKTY